MVKRAVSDLKVLIFDQGLLLDSPRRSSTRTLSVQNIPERATREFMN